MDPSLRNKERTEGRASCAHDDCGHRERVFSPPFDRKVTRVPVQRFPYCLKCGVLKNVSSDKAKLVGWYTNLLHSVNHKLCLQFGKITQAQQRMVIADIERVQDFEDRYHMTRSAQLDLFFIAVHKVRPDIPFWALEQAVAPDPRPKKDAVKELPAWAQYLEWLKKKRAKESARAASGQK